MSKLVRTVFSNNKSITIVQIVHNKNAVWSFVRFYKFGKKSYLLPNLYLVSYSKIKEDGGSVAHFVRYGMATVFSEKSVRCNLNR